MSELTFRPLTTWPGTPTPANDRQRSRFDTPWATRRAAYQSIVMALHPDRRGSDVEFKQLQDAMEVLER